MTAEDGAARALFDRQLAVIAERDLDALLAQYHPEAELVRLDRVVSGTRELREFFAGYLAAGPVVEELHSVRATGDVVLYHATMRVGENRLNAYGTLVIRDGRIWRQTAAAEPVSS